MQLYTPSARLWDCFDFPPLLNEDSVLSDRRSLSQKGNSDFDVAVQEAAISESVGDAEFE
jgi:hypothetical protein